MYMDTMNLRNIYIYSQVYKYICICLYLCIYVHMNAQVSWYMNYILELVMP